MLESWRRFSFHSVVEEGFTNYRQLGVSWLQNFIFLSQTRISRKGIYWLMEMRIWRGGACFRYCWRKCFYTVS